MVVGQPLGRKNNFKTASPLGRFYCKNTLTYGSRTNRKSLAAGFSRIIVVNLVPVVLQRASENSHSAWSSPSTYVWHRWIMRSVDTLLVEASSHKRESVVQLHSIHSFSLHNSMSEFCSTFPGAPWKWWCDAKYPHPGKHLTRTLRMRVRVRVRACVWVLMRAAFCAYVCPLSWRTKVHKTSRTSQGHSLERGMPRQASCRELRPPGFCAAARRTASSARLRGG